MFCVHSSKVFNVNGHRTRIKCKLAHCYDALLRCTMNFGVYFNEREKTQEDEIYIDVNYLDISYTVMLNHRPYIV